jgi:hypothetical protein
MIVTSTVITLISLMVKISKPELELDGVVLNRTLVYLCSVDGIERSDLLGDDDTTTSKFNNELIASPVRSAICNKDRVELGSASCLVLICVQMPVLNFGMCQCLISGRSAFSLIVARLEMSDSNNLLFKLCSLPNGTPLALVASESQAGM